MVQSNKSNACILFINVSNVEQLILAFCTELRSLIFLIVYFADQKALILMKDKKALVFIISFAMFINFFF